MSLTRTTRTSHRHRPARAFGVLCVGVLLALALPHGNAYADELVEACGNYPNEVFAPSSAYGMTTRQVCPAGAAGPIMDLLALGTYQRGQGAIWQAKAPAGLTIVGAGVPAQALSTDVGLQYGANFYWNGGSATITTSSSQGVLLGNFSSPYFGWLLVCEASPCKTGGHLDINEVRLNVRETVSPTFSDNGLWQASGWVRGRWPFSVTADSPAGVCLLAASLNGLSVGETTSGTDSAAWHQCDAGPISTSVDTTHYGQGPLSFGLLAADAAAVHSGANKTIYVDNQQPAVALNGPTDAPSTAGTQYVTATGSAGLSGVAGISCSVDGAPAQWYPGANAQVPVAAVLGAHEIQCFSENSAMSADGVPGSSATESFSMKIGMPTVAGVAFSRIINNLRCHRKMVRVRVPARWVTRRRHGKVVRMRRRAHFERKRVTRCHPRTVRRRVTRVVTIRRHGKKVRVRRHRWVRVVLEPRRIMQTHKRVGYGKPATVFGWIGTSDGVGLPGQPVTVLGAPDDGQEQFAPIASAVTGPDGFWRARIPAGPGRLIEAVYAGSPTTESATSGLIKTVVHAQVKLAPIWPRRVSWGAKIILAGGLPGGYVPRGGLNIRLRYGIGRQRETYGVREHVGTHGSTKFRARFLFGVGPAGAHARFWFQLCTLPGANYPYAPGCSPRQTVQVGGHPIQSRRKHHRRNKEHRKRPRRHAVGEAASPGRVARSQSLAATAQAQLRLGKASR